MAPLVTLDEAKFHLRVDGSDQDADLAAEIARASAVVADYLKTQADPTWTDATVPPVVKTAVLLVLGEIHSHREAAAANLLSQSVIDLLDRSRDPALA